MILDKVGRGNSEGGFQRGTGIAGLSVVRDEVLGVYISDLGDDVLADSG